MRRAVAQEPRLPRPRRSGCRPCLCRPGLCGNLGGDTRQLLKLFALRIEPLSNELNTLVTIRAKAHSIGARVLRAL